MFDIQSFQKEIEEVVKKYSIEQYSMQLIQEKNSPVVVIGYMSYISNCRILASLLDSDQMKIFALEYILGERTEDNNAENDDDEEEDLDT